MTDSKLERRETNYKEALATAFGCAVLLLIFSPLFLAVYVIVHFIRKWW